MRIVRKCCYIKLADYREMCYSICEVMHMLFKRKIYNKFLAWKQEANGQKALLVEGARRIGKSTVVEEFAKNEYKRAQKLPKATSVFISKLLWQRA